MTPSAVFIFLPLTYSSDILKHSARASERKGYG